MMPVPLSVPPLVTVTPPWTVRLPLSMPLTATFPLMMPLPLSVPPLSTVTLPVPVPLPAELVTIRVPALTVVPPL